MRVALCLAAALAIGDGPELATEWVTVTEGLPSNWTTEVIEDDRGALWIGGAGWIATYDGSRMRSWELPGGPFPVEQILPSPDGSLTIRKVDGAVQTWRDGDASELAGPEGRPVYARHLEVSDDGVLLAIVDGALWAHDADADAEWRQLLDGVGGRPLTYVVRAPHGELLLASAEATYLWSRGGAPRRLANVPTYRAAFDGELIWLQERRPARLWRVDANGPRLVLSRPEAGKGLTMRRGSLWVAFTGHLAVVDGAGEVEILETPAPTGTSGRVTATRDGSLWSTNFRGLAHLPDPDLRRWPLTEGSNPIAARFAVEHGGEIWVGSWNDLYRVRGDGSVERPSPILGKGAVCHGDGASLWSLVGGEADGDLTWIAWDEAARPSTYPAVHGDRWTFGCSDGFGDRHWLLAGAHLYLLGAADRAPTVIAETPLAPSNRVRSVLETRAGELWIAAGADVCGAPVDAVLADEASWTCHSVPASHGSIMDLHETSRGTVWLLHRHAGLFELNEETEETVVRVPGSEQLPLGDVRGLSPSPTGGTWIAGMGAIVRVVDEPDGVRVVESVPDWLDRSLSATDDVLELDDGTLYLAGNTGLLQIPPKVRHADEDPPPPVWITELLVDGRPVHGERVHLDRPEESVTVNLSSPNYRAPALVRFRYRVDDRPWSAPSAAHSLVLASLPPGTHRVELVASLDGERWSERPSVIWVTVPQPWYERTWVWILAVVAGMAAVLGIQRARSELAARAQRLRTQVAMDIHDELGAGLGAMGLLAGLIRRGLSEARTRELAGRIADEAHDLGDNVSAIVWSLSPRSSTLGALVEYLEHRATSILADLDPDRRLFSCDPSLADVGVDVDLLRALQLVGIEALSNAARHAQATRVEVRLERAQGGARLSIEDDGVGLPLVRAPAPDRGRGLDGMRVRMRSVGGRVELLPGLVGGTRVEAHFGLRRGWPSLRRFRRSRRTAA